MDLAFTSEDEAYRRRLRAWLQRNAHHARIPRDVVKGAQAARDWQRRLYEAGYVGLAWPKRYGGQEASLTQQVILAEELARSSVPGPVNMVGLEFLGPTLIHHGTEEQKMRFLPKILTAEELWCQGFSEPDAGSDLASLRTRAVLRGDVFVVNGQKIWTSMAQITDWIFLLARTDPTAPKHKGISFLLCEMRTPGITVRPLRTATGALHFSEVFLEDVEIPRENLVGELNGGWRIARTTLAHERSGLASVIDLERHFRDLCRMVVTGQADPDAIDRRQLARLWIEVQGLRYLGYRTLSAQLAGREPAAAAAVGKIFASELRQRLMRTALAAQGAEAQVTKGSAPAAHAGQWQRLYLDSLAYTIAGGTSEVLRNVIAQRVLGLPRDAEAG